MVKINVVCVGRVKEKYFSEGIAEYSKRLSRFCDFEITELPEENFNRADESTVAVIKEREGARILSHLKGFVFVTAPEGQKYSSRSFAECLKKLFDKGTGIITFVIGGSYGLSDRVKERADKLISFSDMTFPHTMFRLILCEQIYRAFSINSGSPYHK